MQNVDAITPMNSADGQPNAHGKVADLVNTLRIRRTSESSWRSLRPTILGLIDKIVAKRVLEIGGGRFPFLTPEEAKARNCELTVNDILESELELAPEVYRKVSFDIAADLPLYVERARYDFVFSRMVFEHVKDGRKAWENVHRLLAPGGIGFAFIPTLWSPPFVANVLMPEAISARILRRIDSDRTNEKVPKFPAYYSLCRADVKVVEPVLAGVGFSEVIVVPFFGTPYLPAVPVLSHVARYFDRVVARFDARTFASYAYIIARK